MKFQLLFLVAALAVYVSAQAPWVCKHSAHYLANTCNHCNCLHGNLACSRFLCFPASPELEHCTEIGMLTQKACNMCVCTKEYGTVCTTDECEDSSSKPFLDLMK